MKFNFQRVKIKDDIRYHLVDYSSCDCIEKLGMVVVGEKTDELTGGNKVGAFIERIEVIEECGYNWENYFYYRINKCPICGENIEIVIGEDIDITQAYLNVIEECRIINDEIEKTDSKKKEVELFKRRRELDKIIDRFFCKEEFILGSKE